MKPTPPSPLAQRAGILCNDTRFQRFAAIRTGAPTDQLTNTAAAHYLRDVCNITSRRDLDTNARAADLFHRLKTNFDAWTGKIANQR